MIQRCMVCFSQHWQINTLPQYIRNHRGLASVSPGPWRQEENGTIAWFWNVTTRHLNTKRRSTGSNVQRCEIIPDCQMCCHKSEGVTVWKEICAKLARGEGLNRNHRHAEQWGSSLPQRPRGRHAHWLLHKVAQILQRGKERKKDKQTNQPTNQPDGKCGKDRCVVFSYKRRPWWSLSQVKHWVDGRTMTPPLDWTASPSHTQSRCNPTDSISSLQGRRKCDAYNCLFVHSIPSICHTAA